MIEEHEQEQLPQDHQIQRNNLLHQYEDVFQEIENLPPVRSHDHKIILKEGTDPISV